MVIEDWLKVLIWRLVSGIVVSDVNEWPIAATLLLLPPFVFPVFLPLFYPPAIALLLAARIADFRFVGVPVSLSLSLLLLFCKLLLILTATLEFLVLRWLTYDALEGPAFTLFLRLGSSASFCKTPRKRRMC